MCVCVFVCFCLFLSFLFVGRGLLVGCFDATGSPCLVRHLEIVTYLGLRVPKPQTLNPKPQGFEVGQGREHRTVTAQLEKVLGTYSWGDGYPTY